jgi:hypothetical protein
MIHFDPPYGPQVPAVPGNRLQTEADVETAFAGLFPRPLPDAALTLDVDIHRAAGVLFSDAKGGLLPSACLWICRSLFIVGAGSHLVGAPRLRSLPTHTKRVMSELSAAALSLAASEALGVDYFCTVSEFNKVFNGVTRHWAGDGPDYLVWDTTSGDICFLECKGISTAPSPKPPGFAEKKAQSLNAVPAFFTVQAHILSVSYMAPGTECRLRWFNHRQMVEEGHRNKAAGLAIALQQFVRQLTNAGFENLAQAFAITPEQQPGALPWEGVEDLVQMHFAPGQLGWQQREDADVVVIVQRGRFGFFFSAARALSVNNFDRAERMGARLVKYASAVRRARDAEEAETNVIYRSTTGVSLVRRHGAPQ